MSIDFVMDIIGWKYRYFTLLLQARAPVVVTFTNVSISCDYFCKLENQWWSLIQTKVPVVVTFTNYSTITTKHQRRKHQQNKTQIKQNTYTNNTKASKHQHYGFFIMPNWLKWYLK